MRNIIFFILVVVAGCEESPSCDPPSCEQFDLAWTCSGGVSSYTFLNEPTCQPDGDAWICEDLEASYTFSCD